DAGALVGETGQLPVVGVEPRHEGVETRVENGALAAFGHREHDLLEPRARRVVAHGRWFHRRRRYLEHLPQEAARDPSGPALPRGDGDITADGGRQVAHRSPLRKTPRTYTSGAVRSRAGSRRRERWRTRPRRSSRLPEHPFHKGLRTS